MAAANPMRGLAAHAAAVSDLIRTIDGPSGAGRTLVWRRPSARGSCASDHERDFAVPLAGLAHVHERPRLVQASPHKRYSGMRPTIVLVHGAFADSSNRDVEASCT